LEYCCGNGTRLVGLFVLVLLLLFLLLLFVVVILCVLTEYRFGEALSTRINNTMLVSALLITVTTAILLAPPQYEVSFKDIGNDSTNTRAFFYFCSIVNLMFIISIIWCVSLSTVSLSLDFSLPLSLSLGTSVELLLLRMVSLSHHSQPSNLPFSLLAAMSRAYTQADKMILIAKHYYVLNISQTLSMLGAFFFVFVIVIPTWSCMSSLSPPSVSLYL
jgi:hypothetical protein